MSLIAGLCISTEVTLAVCLCKSIWLAMQEILTWCNSGMRPAGRNRVRYRPVWVVG